MICLLCSEFLLSFHFPRTPIDTGDPRTSVPAQALVLCMEMAFQDQAGLLPASVAPSFLSNQLLFAARSRQPIISLAYLKPPLPPPQWLRAAFLVSFKALFSGPLSTVAAFGQFYSDILHSNLVEPQTIFSGLRALDLQVCAAIPTLRGKKRLIEKDWISRFDPWLWCKFSHQPEPGASSSIPMEPGCLECPSVLSSPK